MIFVGLFFILHGLVHLLYAGQALRFFELRPGLTWPDGAWAFSRVLGDSAARWLAAVSLALAAHGFVAAGVGLPLKQEWWRPITTGAALLSILIFFLFWDAKLQALPDKGGVGLLISLAILVIIGLFWSGPAPLQTGAGINQLEQVELGGVKQWISIRATNQQNPVLLQFGGVYHTTRSYTHEIWMMLNAPEYSFAEVALWPVSSSNALKGMWPDLMKVNFFDEVPTVHCPIYFFL